LVRPTAKKLAKPLAGKGMKGLLKMNAEPPIAPTGSASWRRTLDNGLAGGHFGSHLQSSAARRTLDPNKRHGGLQLHEAAKR
jgi:hypothetical protein